MDILAKTILDNIVKKANNYKSDNNLYSNCNNLSNHEENLLKDILNKVPRESKVNINDDIKISLSDLSNKVSKKNNTDKYEFNTVSLESLWKK